MKLVSVICLCYNQAAYIEEAIESVYAQTYSAVELIVVNDASTDNSRQTIQQLKVKYPAFVFIDNEKNKGMCASFNSALAVAKGEYCIDLAADDSLTEDRIALQVSAFEKLDHTYGVVFSDAYIVDEARQIKKTFYRRSSDGLLLENVPHGDVFKYVVHSYKICSPTMMVRKLVFDEIGGYDEALSYEDYDFFIRSARHYRYYFIDKPLVYKRELKKSASKDFYKKRNNEHLKSTLIISKKALWLCKTPVERQALLHAIRYHYRQSYFLGDVDLALQYQTLIRDMGYHSNGDKLIGFLSKLNIPVYRLYWLYRLFWRS
jgi:glycosyltransferase involved in cell wall biosynthesis